MIASHRNFDAPKICKITVCKHELSHPTSGFFRQNISKRTKEWHMREAGSDQMNYNYYLDQRNWDSRESWRWQDDVRSCDTALDHERSAPNAQPLNAIFALRSWSSTSNSVLSNSTSWFSAISIFLARVVKNYNVIRTIKQRDLW